VIRIDTFGGLSVRGDDGKPLPGAAAQPRRMAILALLARAGERGLSREKLLALLWPDADDERGPRALAQALYALRKDLGAEDAIVGSRALRLESGLVSSDVGEHAAAVARGDDARAVALHRGPFLDGFHLPGAAAFERWVEEERRTLRHEYARALESLARGARAAGAVDDAVAWWRRLAALDPLDARVTVGLMEALDAAGDRTAALRHVHVYQALVQQELDLPPDREVLALAERLRRSGPPMAAPVPEAAPVATPVATPVSTPVSSSDVPSDVPPVAAPVIVAPPRARRRTIAAAGAALLVALLAAVALLRRPVGVAERPAASRGMATVAIGRIVSYGSDTTQAGMAAAVADLLTTSLARVSGIQVVSHGRMLELMRRRGGAGDTSAGRVADAAREAGATEVIEGTLYARPAGRLRLDVRRVDLESGAIGDVHTVEGSDLFALVDSGTARLVTALGSTAPAGSVSDVTTRSVTAYRLYERGIRAYYGDDPHAARALFDGALAEDSLFALAAYYGAISASDDGVEGGRDSVLVLFARAKRLASRAPDRERLTILADWAYRVSDPRLRQYAESLATRYPAEVEGHLYAGIGLVLDGDFLAAVAPLERVIAMDSSGLRGVAAACSACDAFVWLTSVYTLADSLPAAERVARRWVRREPRSLKAARTLVEQVEMQDRPADAEALFRNGVAGAQTADPLLSFWTPHYLRMADYAAADRLLVAQTRVSSAPQRLEALWQLAISLRQQGRFADALEAARRLRREERDRAAVGGLTSDAVMEAQILLESGRAHAAAALFDSLARARYVGEEPSALARRTAWTLTQSACARLAAGDTAGIDRLVDSVRVAATASGYGRDRRLPHHVAGLLLALRGDTAGAIRELRAAIYSPSSGYTRTNAALAQLYLATGRARDAVAIVQPALHGSLEASNLYVTRTELHELLARAWDAAGRRDSATAHWSIVARSWSAPDPLLAPRAAAARSRLASR